MKMQREREDAHRPAYWWIFVLVAIVLVFGVTSMVLQSTSRAVEFGVARGILGREGVGPAARGYYG